MQERKKKILIVEPDRAVRETIMSLLKDDYESEAAENDEDALKRAEDFVPDIAVVAVSIPDSERARIFHRLKLESSASNAQVIVTSKNPSGAEETRVLEADADDYLSADPLDADLLMKKLRLHSRLQDATTRLKPAIRENQTYGSKLERLIAERTRELIESQEISIVTLTLLAEYREPEGGKRLWRKRYYSSILAARLCREGSYIGQVDVKFIDNLYRATALYDIGKIGVSDAILLKKGPLSPAEWEVSKDHTIIGSALLSQLLPQSNDDGFLEMATSIARWHHERFDGRGYPSGLAGEEIPLAARIVSVVDAYDAMTDPRTARVAETPESACGKIAEESGLQFDPIIVEAFKASLPELIEVQKTLEDPATVVTGAAAFLD